MEIAAAIQALQSAYEFSSQSLWISARELIMEMSSHWISLFNDPLISWPQHTIYSLRFQNHDGINFMMEPSAVILEYNSKSKPAIWDLYDVGLIFIFAMRHT